MLEETCLVCGKPIAANTRKCPHCNTEFNPTVYVPQEVKKELAALALELDAISLGQYPPDVQSTSSRMKGILVLTDVKTQKEFRVAIAKIQLAVLGRSNQSGYMPTVDLMEVDGAKRGVSRYHATININNDTLCITDHNSTNGTFVNGKPVKAGETVAFEHDDVIQVGVFDSR